MPIIDYNGERIQIPYDPELLAQLIYQGHKIYPDEGTSQDQRGIHNQEIGMYLRKLWGDKQYNSTMQRSEDPGKKERDTNFMGLQVNPFTNYPINEIDSNTLLGKALNMKHHQTWGI